MNLSDDGVVDDQIRKLVSDSPPLAVERRLRSQLAEFRSRLSAAGPHVARNSRGRPRPAAWWRIGATCAAAVVLVAAVALLFRPQTSFAEVQAAVLRQPWIHLRTVFADQSVSEGWLSPNRGVSASRECGSVRYEDYRLQIYYSYDPEEQVVYRGPIVATTSPGSEFKAIGEAIKVLLEGDGLPERPLDHMGFLGSERDKMTVLEQRVDKITQQEQTWLDYRSTVQHTGLADPVKVLFRVDTRTKLPQLCRVEAVQDGKPATLEMQFDYPEKGPADIYDLGVPDTAKLVDRVPAGDLKLILETIEAGRERMDNYRAVYVNQLELPGHDWLMSSPEVLYRKGDRYRRDLSMRGPDDKGPHRPAADENRRQWWFERVKHYRYYPVDVQRGPMKYTCTWESAAAQRQELTEVAKYEDKSKPGELFPVDYAMRPEFVCRPPMGIGNPHHEPSLDLHPADGPAGCILLTVTRTTKAGQWDIEPANLDRFWLDPQRDYIALRWEMVTRAGTGEEFITSQHVVEETARSPQGVWYATRIRVKNAARDKDGKAADQLYHLYVDFDAELPDALFEVPTRGRIE